jgi:signal transduction histidine kinase
MAAGVAHEIRNPLGGIRLYTDLLLRRLEGEGLEWENKTAGKIRRNIIQLEQIVRDMLDFTKEVVIRRETANMEALLRESMDLAEYERLSRDHEILVDARPTTLCVDAHQLQRVFLNIILNAYQAMEDGGKLVIQGYCDERNYVLHFQDTGMGIPEDKLEDVFNPFMTTKHEGTGLGLAIAFRVMEEHEGRIEIRNNETRGVTVTLRLPLEH